MRYLVRARVKPGCEGDLLQTIEDESLGQGSVAEGEYLRNMSEARLCADQTVRWVEVCYCPTPLQKNGLTGKNISISRRCRTPTTVANAAMKVGASRGLAATAIARRAWS